MDRQAAHETIIGRMEGILSAAEADHRQLTQPERELWDSLEAGLVALHADRPGWKSPPRDHAGFNQWSRTSQGRRIAPDKPGGTPPASVPMTPCDRAVERFIDRDGRDVAVLAPDQTFAAHFGTASDLSLGRAIRGVVTGRWEGASREMAAMMGGNDTAGGFLLPEPLANFVIDKARNASVLVAAGARTIPMQTGQLSIARVDSDPTASWRTEGSTLSTTQASIGQIVMYSRMLACLVPVTVELLSDAPNAGVVIEDCIAGAIGAELDRAGFHGVGAAAEPMGIANQTGINTRTVGGALNPDLLLTALGDIETDNGAANAVVMNPTERTTYRKFKDGNGQYLQIHKDIASLKHFTTKNVSAGTIFMGDFSQLLIGMRTDQVVMELLKEGTVGSDNAISQFKRFIRCYIRADIALAHPDHFCTLTGIT